MKKSSETASIGLFPVFSGPPEYSLDQDYLQVVAGSSPHVNFTITSHPPLEEVRHTLRKKDGGPVSKRFKVEGERIIFWNVSVSDSGSYTISCCDEEGEEGEETMELEVLPGNPAGQLSPPINPQSQQTGVYR